MIARKRDLANAILSRPAVQGKSQTEIAKLVGLNQSQISRVLNGHYAGLPKSVRTVCRYAGVDWREYVVAPEPTKSNALMGALRSAWNGTQEHEKLLARIILACRNY